MKRYLKFLLPLLIVIFIFIYWQTKDNSSTKNSNQDMYASLKIKDIDPPSTFDISSFVGKSALEATEAKAKVVTNGTGVNAFVTSINERVADSRKKEFWEFLVNEKQATVGAGSYIIQNHDEIQWKITNF